MSSSSKASNDRFFKVVLGLVVVLFGLCVLGRNTLILGTGLIMGRYLFLMAFGLLFIWKRTHKLLLYGLCGVVLLELGYTYSQTKSPEPLKESTKRIRVLSYNLRFNNQQHVEMGRIIQEQNPDVLLVQELSQGWNRFLTKTLKKSHPYHQTYPKSNAYGMGLFSKYPIHSTQYLWQYRGLPFAQNNTIQIEEKSVRICNTHLESPAIALENLANFGSVLHQNHTRRIDEYKNLEHQMSQATYGPQILMGDLNTMPIEPLYRTISQDWCPLPYAIRRKGLFTFPAHAPYPAFLALDHAFFRGEIAPIHAELIKNGTSDHHGILVDFEL